MRVLQELESLRRLGMYMEKVKNGRRWMFFAGIWTSSVRECFRVRMGTASQPVQVFYSQSVVTSARISFVSPNSCTNQSAAVSYVWSVRRHQLWMPGASTTVGRPLYRLRLHQRADPEHCIRFSSRESCI